jgi:hypothetical protein
LTGSPDTPEQTTTLDPHPQGRLIERWFGLLTDKLIRRGVHTSVPALENEIKAWIATWNDNPRPFTWTKTAGFGDVPVPAARVRATGGKSRCVTVVPANDHS